MTDDDLHEEDAMVLYAAPGKPAVLTEEDGVINKIIRKSVSFFEMHFITEEPQVRFTAYFRLDYETVYDIMYLFVRTDSSFVPSCRKVKPGLHTEIFILDVVLIFSTFFFFRRTCHE